MIQQAKRFFVLFVSVVILLTGHGLQLTLLPLRGEALGLTVGEIGMTGSAYFLGFLLGCVLIPRFVASVGHIRTFSTTTTLCGSALLLILLSDDPWVWAGLRFLTGAGISGCYVIIESWLNEQIANQYRGRLMAFYTMLVMGSMSVGQLLVSVDLPTAVAPVVLGSLLLYLAIVPVSLTRVDQPKPLRRVEFPFREIFRASPAAVGTAFAAALVTSILYTLTPVFARQIGFSVPDISLLMITMVLGGALLQYPAGRLSDHFDRRRVMVGLLLTGTLVALIAIWLVDQRWMIFTAMFLIGGLATAIYPICLSHANDRYPGHFLQIGTVILLVNGIGAVVGPSLGAQAMSLLHPQGFFVHVAAGMLITLLWLLYCLRVHRETPPVEAPFVGTPKATEVLAGMDPRAQEDPAAGAGQATDASEADPQPR